MAAARTGLAGGASVVVDATNIDGDGSVRGEWAALAASAGVPIRAIVFTDGKPAAFHFNTLRGASPLGGAEGPADRRVVPDVVIHGMAKKMLSAPPPPPSSSRGGGGGGIGGFASVTHVVVKPGPFYTAYVGGGGGGASGSGSEPEQRVLDYAEVLAEQLAYAFSD